MKPTYHSKPTSQKEMSVTVTLLHNSVSRNKENPCIHHRQIPDRANTQKVSSSNSLQNLANKPGDLNNQKHVSCYLTTERIYQVAFSRLQHIHHSLGS